MARISPPNILREKGAAAVEFALVASAFFVLFLGIIEMGRVLFVWNSAAEATRLGARVAVVCDKGDAAILAKMQTFIPDLTTMTTTPCDATSQVCVDYEPSGCDQGNCETVTVSVRNYSIAPMIPFLNMNLPIPPFATSLTRESMESAIGGDPNPVCS